jgi:large subunit ribosomal protein L22
MLSSKKLKAICKEKNIDAQTLASGLSGYDEKKALTVVKNWLKGLYKPAPKSSDVADIASVLSVDKAEISAWKATYKYAPSSPRKARLVTQLINGRNAQDALDVLKFTPKRAAGFVKQVLQSAIASADEAEADIENLYVIEARVDGAGRRIGTKGWIAKDRGRAHPIRKEASHIYVTLAKI